MQLKFFSLFIALSFAACQSDKKFDIIGTWTSTNVKDNTGMNITDKIDFNKDGSCELTMYSNGDSILSELKGLYRIDSAEQTLTIKTDGMSFKHKILNIEKENLRMRTSQGIEMTMKRIK